MIASAGSGCLGWPPPRCAPRCSTWSIRVPGLCSIRCSAASVRGQTSRQGHRRLGHPSATGCSWAASRSRRDDPRWAATLAFRPPGREAGLGPRAPAAATPGSTPVAPSSSPRPSTSHLPGGASPSSATTRAGGRPPFQTQLRGRRRPRRPPGRWRDRRSDGPGASRAPQPVERLRRLGEPHRDRKVDGRGAVPLAPTITRDLLWMAMRATDRRQACGTLGPGIRRRVGSSAAARAASGLPGRSRSGGAAERA